MPTMGAAHMKIYPMPSIEMDACYKAIETNRCPSGGFGEQPGGMYRPDCTAWAILALARKGLTPPLVDSARDSLRTGQLPEGGVAYPGAPAVYWPTPLAVMAWHGSPKHRDAQRRALGFLLETSGHHWKMDPDAPTAHDPSLRGWPWISGTHSFVETTALCMLALEMTGNSRHPRFGEAARMLMDRQLPHGGWNYGNTLVYGKELFPFKETTGIALAALGGHVELKDVERSLLYLREEIKDCRTPLSLGWALFGLGAWGERPREASAWIEESLREQAKFGPYRTSLLALLALAHSCQGNFRKLA